MVKKFKSWKFFLLLSTLIAVLILTTIASFLYYEDQNNINDLDVAQTFTCTDGSNSFPHPVDVVTCPIEDECSVRQVCYNRSHPQGIGGSHPFCNPGETQIIDGQEYLCVGYPYESDGCVYITGCRGLRATGNSTTDSAPAQLCGADGFSNCTLVNDGVCGANNPNQQRILCVSNVDNVTVCYERNEECVVVEQNPVVTDPIDQPDPTEQGSSVEDSQEESNSANQEQASNQNNSQGNSNNVDAAVGSASGNLSTLPNTSSSETFSKPLFLGLLFLMFGLTLNRFGNKDMLVSTIGYVESKLQITFPNFFTDFIEKRNKNMVDYERKRFEKNIENERESK